MSKQIDALELALEALERGETELRWKAITTIKEALAQPEQEPVAWNDENVIAYQQTKIKQVFEMLINAMKTPEARASIVADSIAILEKLIHAPIETQHEVYSKEQMQIYADANYEAGKVAGIKEALAQPKQFKPLTDDEAFELIEQDYQMEEYAQAALQLIRRTEAAHGIKEKNT